MWTRLEEAIHSGESETIYFTITPAPICETNLKYTTITVVVTDLGETRALDLSWRLSSPSLSQTLFLVVKYS